VTLRETSLNMPRGAPHAGVGHRELSLNELLDNARPLAEQLARNGVTVVDADFHSREEDDWSEILDYLDNDVWEHLLRTSGGGRLWIPGGPASGRVQEMGERLRAATAWREARAHDPGAEGHNLRLGEVLDAIGISRVLLFPQHILNLGSNPFPELEVQIARAHARWLTERVLSADPRFISSLFLPLSDPEACLDLVEQHGDHPGVVGFTITSSRYEALHTKAYLPIFSALQERRLALVFHSSFSYREPSMRMFNRFLSLHAMGFPHFNMVHATNWIVNGMPERFPELDLVFVESGLAWIPFLMQRLDHTVMMRPSEAPLLTRLPSEYMRRFYYTTQPMEATSIRELQATLEFIGANDRLLYASDFPHWDWDPPSRIWDLPFLDEADKRAILGANAERLFGFDGAAHSNGSRS
jgi:predicted TIM-barrel fold metal-dependent hydrolase